MATSTIKYMKQDNNAQAQGNTAVTLAATDKNLTLATLTPTNDFCHLTANGALSFDKSGKYLLLGNWICNGLTSGDTLTFSIRKWDGSSTSTLETWGISTGGAYFSYNAFIIAGISVGDALFMSARNNSSARGNFTFARLIAIKL